MSSNRLRTKLLSSTIRECIDKFKDDSLEMICVSGWIRRLRKHKNVIFADVHDGSQIQGIQLAIKPDDFHPV